MEPYRSTGFSTVLLGRELTFLSSFMKFLNIPINLKGKHFLAISSS